MSLRKGRTRHQSERPREFDQIVAQRRRDCDHLAVLRMHKRGTKGVQSVSRMTDRRNELIVRESPAKRGDEEVFAAEVQLVADDRVSEMLEMHANLMLSTRVRARLDERGIRGLRQNRELG